MTSQRVGFLGLGIMGSRMAATLRRAGFELTVWTHTPGKAQAWAEEHGAAVAATPAEAAAGAGIVITMLVDGNQVEAVQLGEQGAADGAAPGTLFVDMSTIGPAATRAIGERLSERGMRMLDAPVTGSSPKAADGTLTIMTGGDEADHARALPLLETMGALVVHVGALGQGQMLKLINNTLAAANLVSVGQALLVAQATGVDLDALEQVVGSGSGASTMLDLKAGPMRRHDYATRFKLEHLLKDVRLCLEAGQAAGVPFPAAAAAGEVLIAGVSRGHGGADMAAVIAPLEGLAGRELQGRALAQGAVATARPG